VQDVKLNDNEMMMVYYRNYTSIQIVYSISSIILIKFL